MRVLMMHVFREFTKTHPAGVPTSKDMEASGQEYNEELGKACVLSRSDGLTPPATISRALP